MDFTVIPKDLKCGDVTLHSLWARRHGTKFNGAPYIVQRAGAGSIFRSWTESRQVSRLLTT